MTTPCVGLTGGVASGKSLVASHFSKLGVPVLDADQVARQVVAPGSPALHAIAETFGRQYLQADGSLDRRRLRERIFTDTAARERLEAITHPAIECAVQAWRAAQTAAYCIYSVAILVRIGARDRVDRVLVVDAPVEVQLRRLMARDHQPEALARKMIAAQAPRAAHLAVADDILDNGNDDALIVPQVHRLHQLYARLESHDAHAFEAS